MLNKIVKILLLAAVFLITVPAFATHNRAGEIVYKHISGYKYKLIIYTYCYTLTDADRDELELDCGDGTPKEVLKRTSKTFLDDGSNFNDNTKEFHTLICKNVYVGEHTFSGPGAYTLYMEDPNRNEGVDNIPNSVNVVFAIKTTLMISPLAGNNSSPVLLNAPIDKAGLNKVFVHNPGAFDPDGDSLSYKIARCLTHDGVEIVGYSLPPVTDSIFVDPYSGDFVWDRPSKKGSFNVAMVIEEWRNGVKIGEVLRDIQVDVEDTDNHTPIIDPIANHCVIADSTLEFTVTAHDPDAPDLVELTASGGVFEMEINPAKFIVTANWSKTPVGHFYWHTHQSHVRRLPYEVLFRAVDDDIKVPLTAYRKNKITVIAPEPEIISAQPSNNSIKLTWTRGRNYNATGFKIYRRSRPDDFKSDVCETGVPAEWEYELIKVVSNPNDTVFTDDNNGILLPQGFCYCYRVTATFVDGAESKVSKPACVVLSRGTIALTQATVVSTSDTEGEIHLEWMTPTGIDFDVVKPPYAYLIYPAHGIYDGIYTNPIQIDGIKDTTYTQSHIDTYSKGSIYKICFTNQDPETGRWVDHGTASMASSVFIKLECSNRAIKITHEADVPWQNDTFIIYRRDPGKADFDSIGYSTDGTYFDQNLTNDVEYFYKMKTIGYYSEEGLPTHIENWSQIASGIPLDTIPPCVKLNLISDCDNAVNKLQWYPDTVCGLDISKYQIYYSETIDGELQMLAETEPTVLEYEHHPTIGMAGCYVVTATDFAGNTGTTDQRTCIDNCEYYRLPNVFTPNGDGLNDVFHPYPYQFVDHIDMTITNRWGKVVYKTNDPDINWDGNDQQSGTKLPDGVYFYRCTVYEYRLTGLEDRELEGFITIITDKTEKK